MRIGVKKRRFRTQKIFLFSVSFSVSFSVYFLLKSGHWNPQMTQKKTGWLKNNKKLSGYSLSGLKAAWLNEAAFRQEAVLCIILIPLAFFTR
ncbi:membrane protein [Beggiatoa sp. SS]|nr:membrane protein [Beggiatoa sp. SS]